MTNSPAGSGHDGAVHVDSTDAFDTLLGTEQTVLVDFYADWCGPCLMMADTVDELASESDRAVVKVDVEQLPAVAARYEISSIPAFVVFEDGEPSQRFVGMQEKATLQAAID